jgi:Rrf2 family protein
MIAEAETLDLTLTKRGDYTLRAAISLAKAYPMGGYRKIREIAQEMDLPLRYTPQILHLLLKAGLAEARAGQQGGYRLVCSPDKISLLEVIEAAEGPPRPDRCTLRGGPCHWESMCAVHPIWDDARAALTQVLGKRSLASVVAVDAKLEAETFPIPEQSHRLKAQTVRVTKDAD